MVTFAQAQERAERWVNGSVAGELQRAVRVREFDLGFVAWAEDRAGQLTGGGKLVIARDSGDTTLWPALPVSEVIAAYEAVYGSTPGTVPAPEPPQRVDLEATSFLLTPPGWLQEAADRAASPGGGPAPAPPPVPPVPAPAAPPEAEPAPEPRPVGGAPAAAASPWAGTDTSGSGTDVASVAPPATVFSPPLQAPGERPAEDQPDPEARTAVLPQGSGLPRTAVAPSLPPTPAPPGSSSAPPAPPAPPRAGPGAANLADADTAKAASVPARPGPGAPPPPGTPGTPGGRPEPGPAPEAEPGGYVPTRMVSADDVQRQGEEQRPQEQPGQGPGGVHQAATMLAPGPPAEGAPAAPPPAAPSPPATPPPAPATPGGYGYPPASSVPAVGSGYMAVLRYRAPDGSEQRLIRRSAPGLPHPEWQLLHELHAMGVPPQQVIELHTELQSCRLPGGYCSRMIQETWPQVRITHTAPYGTDFASRQAGVRHLVEHQDELEQYADGPARTAPVRAPLPQSPTAAAIGLDAIGQELAEAYGPQAVFRFDQHAVARQGVPDVVAQTLVWSGLPLEIGPFFWAQAQPGRPIPTLAELAQERGVTPGPDAGSYLVIGTDFGRQLCVQYGSACIVAVPLEQSGPGGQPAAPQFVNASLPQFVRSLALLGRMWRLRYGLTPEQAGHWTTDFQRELATLDGQALADPESWWSVLLEQMWDGLL